MDPSGRGTEVFVISDLHIGGKYAADALGRGFRINTHIDALARFIAEVGDRAKGKGIPTELVINGDFVDFLAEEAGADARRRSFIDDQADAVTAFEAIVKRDAAVFAALRNLLADGVAVTVVLGNHDIELSLPAVRSRLSTLLNPEDATRFKFIYDGEAYVIGDVLIEHGNRYDGWNVIDHDRLRRFRSEASRRLDISPDAQFSPPAGSVLVERVMNPIKEDYPFIDLLKPETDAALPLLVALEPDFANVAAAIELRRLQQEASRRAPVGPARPAQPGDIASSRVGAGLDPLKTTLARRVQGSAQSELLRLVDLARSQPHDIAASAFSRALSFMRLKGSASFESRLTVLLGTLRALQGDASFNRTNEAQHEYLDAAAQLAAKGFAAIVFGHTHLAKEQMIGSGAKYLNTGTWADLIRVPDEIIHAPLPAAMESLRAFAQAIRNRDMNAHLLFRPTFAHIRLDSNARTRSAHVLDYAQGTVTAL